MARDVTATRARWPPPSVLGLLAIATGVLIAHSLIWNFVTDDAFISFVYARNLAEHGELVFNLGERVEGYTNFLWTVVLAGLLGVGLEPELMSRVLGTAFAVATFATCAVLLRRLRDETWSPWHALPALLLAGIPGYACWSSGGLETQMFTFFVTLGFARYLDRGACRSSAIAFGLAALTRPEGTLFFVGVVALHAVRRLAGRRERALRPSRDELMWLAWFAALVVPHLLWRRSYYGWWFPNTFYTKTGGWTDGDRWSQGWYYVSQFVRQFHVWAVVPLVVAGGLINRARRRATARSVATLYLFGLSASTVFLVYVSSVGGDFMGLFRFVVPVLPLLVLCAVVGLRDALDGLPALAQLAVVVALLIGHGWHAARVDRESLRIGADRGIDTPGYLRWYTADRAAIGKWFGRHARPDDYAAVGGAGAQVYYSRIPSLDCFGLSDAYIAHEVKATSVRPGHQKYAPLAYQLSKNPTIITSNYYRIGKTPHRPSAMEAEQWRRRGYRYESVQIEGLSSPWYSFLLRLDRSIP